jgi:two-component system KDP operon response regulator KdpE
MVAAQDAGIQRRVLIIDDEPQISRVLAVGLNANGYRTDIAMDGREGLAAAPRFGPDVIIVDLGLPDIDGVEVIKSLRRWTQIPVIVLSARSADSDKVQALDAGADDCIAKPFDEAELLARLRAAIRRAGQADPAWDSASGHERPLVKSSQFPCMDFVRNRNRPAWTPLESGMRHPPACLLGRYSCA